MLNARALIATGMVAGILLLGGCGKDDPPQAKTLQLVGLGDSVMTQGDAEGTSFVHQFAKQLEARDDTTTVVVKNRGSASETSDTLLMRLRNEESLRSAVRDADIVVISVGGNDADPFGEYPAGTCTGEPADACLATYAPNLAGNLDAVADVIGELRDGKPTALRMMADYNPFVGWADAPDADFGVRFYADVLDAEAAALCAVATEHSGTCLETFRLFGGPDGTQDAAPFLDSDHLHPGPAGLTAIVDALAALGIAELEG